MHTVSRKSERLVNLTSALLATKRWLTKTQIFSAIDGYEGEADAMERMFERDKDDLRKLGIIIEVGSFDPLFEDEVGYRIRPDNYKIDIDEISSLELSLISQATQVWKGAVLDSTALSALVKLKSLGVDSDLDSLPSLRPHVAIPQENFSVVVDAIAERKTISFFYIAADLSRQSRVIEPYGAGTKGGHWYVAGRDIEKQGVRLFRMDRIDSEIKEQGRSKSYEIPSDFSMSDQLKSPEKNSFAFLKVRRGKAHRLRSVSTIEEEGDEWSTIRYPYLRESELIEDVLWHLDDVQLLEPVSARVSIQALLREIVSAHG